jgi:hypothetical protein
VIKWLHEASDHYDWWRFGKALDSYVNRQDAPPAFTALVQAALREYLARRGAAQPSHPLRISPAKRGSGKSDVSKRHDAYFAADA